MRSKQQPRPSFRWPQQRGDNLTGEDGVEGSGPGLAADLQGEEGDCAEDDGPISPSERVCAAAAKETEDGDATDDEEDEDATPPTPPPSATARLNPTILRDTGPPDREPMSPRCPSRDSRESSGPATGSPPPPATRSSASPVSPSGIVPLPLGGHPLLPPHSAAMMAAYLQQTHQRLLLGHSPLSRGSVSPLVSSSCSPPAATPGLLVSPSSVGDVSPSATPLPAVLDFSTRKASSTEDDEEEQILNLSKPPTPSSSTETNNGPLDLSVPSRKRPGPEDSPPPPVRKSSRLASGSAAAAAAAAVAAATAAHQDPAQAVAAAAAAGFGRPPVVSPWTSPVVASHFPYFAAAVAAAATSQQQLSPKSTAGVVVDHHQIWNGKIKAPSALENKYQPSEATKALEKMSELSKLGGEDLFRSASGTGSGGGSGAGGAGGGSGAGGAGSASGSTSGSRHSAWQSHWLNKGADQAKDVLKCVWCKQSFPTLAAMTTHMKEAKHCGVNMPVPPSGSALHPQQSSLPNIPTPQPPHQPQTTSASNVGAGPGAGGSATPSSKQSPSELNLLIKETMPLPRKLVRGQDVWLGKGAEQTRQILKCMWCGQSFRSLAEMTSHMQQTQHYTNIISQEQIISWKSSDENKGGGGGSGGGGSGGGSGSGAVAGGGGGGTAVPGGNAGATGPHAGSTGAPGSGAASSHVSAVLTCKVCDQAFSSLKELSNHMVKNSHYKEHIMRSITESGGRRRQTREKRKKSLPVRKLLELERAQNEFKNGDAAAGLGHGLGKHAGRITCEKCGDKIETTIFVDHIRQCIGAGTVSANQRNFLKNALMSNHLSATLPPTESGRKSVNEDGSPLSSSRHHRSPSSASDATTPGKDTPTPTAGNETTGSSSSPSVLNAIEKLIEKSFDSRARHGAPGLHHAQPGAPMGTSILKRLGIDESVDYTKPLVDPQTMNLLRSYQQQQQQQQQQQHYSASMAARRERSGSESSSVSERGSGGRTDAMTPERRLDLSAVGHSERHSSHHHRVTPDKQLVPQSLTAGRHHPAAEESGDEDPGAAAAASAASAAGGSGAGSTAGPGASGLSTSSSTTAPTGNAAASTASSTVVVKKEPKDEETEERATGDEDASQAQASSREVYVKKEIVDDCRDEEEQSSFNHTRRGSSIHESAEDGREVLSPRINPPTPRSTGQMEQLVRSPCRNSTSSPTSSDRSVTPRGTPDTKGSSSLGALSSMFDSLSGGGSGGGGAGGGPGGNAGGAVDSHGRKASSHPLAALQKLCDKTETRGGGGGSGSGGGGGGGGGSGGSGGSGRSAGGPGSTSGLGSAAGGGVGATGPGSGTTPGAILAFSWACNDAVVTPDSIMKCAFCDTPFISKGAYRHHLSKMHFVKDGVIPDPLTIGRSAAAAAAVSQNTTAGPPTGHSSSSPPTSQRNKSPPLSQANGSPSQSAASPLEESPHSKFLKYTELAKQLSSKYV